MSAGNKKRRIEVKRGGKKGRRKKKKKRDIKIFLCKLNTSETSLPGQSWTVSGSESARTRVHTVADCIFAISSPFLFSIPLHFLLLLLLLLPPPLSGNSDERRRLCGSGNDQGTDSVVERVEGETMRSVPLLPLFVILSAGPPFLRFARLSLILLPLLSLSFFSLSSFRLSFCQGMNPWF